MSRWEAQAAVWGGDGPGAAPSLSFQACTSKQALQAFDANGSISGAGPSLPESHHGRQVCEPQNNARLPCHLQLICTVGRKEPHPAVRMFRMEAPPKQHENELVTDLMINSWNTVLTNLQKRDLKCGIQPQKQTLKARPFIIVPSLHILLGPFQAAAPFWSTRAHDSVRGTESPALHALD